MRLTGKVALVTGAQQGIGAAIALALGREGAAVVVNYLDDEAAAAAVAEQVRGHGVGATTVPGSVTRPDDIAAFMEAADGLGGIDILINNAGIFPRVPFLDMEESQWDEVIDTNLKGEFLCAQAAARRMVQTGRSGAIVNISSAAAYRPSPQGAHYAASKAGILGLTRAMAGELAGAGIRVNVIAPGLTDTAQPRYGMSEEALEQRAQALPLGRMGQPEDIADAAVFLASNESRYITGQVIHVNGGDYLG